AGNIGPQLFGVVLHVVGGDYKRALRRRQQPGDIGHLLLLLRMEHIPAGGGLAVAGELVGTGDAPDIGLYLVVLAEHVRRGDHLVENGAGPHQLHPGLVLGGLGALSETVTAANYALLGARWHLRVVVVLVHGGDVVEDVFLVPVHALETVLNDHRQLVAKRRVIAAAVGDGVGQDMTVAVLVLQTLAVEGGAAGGGADQKAPGLHIPGSPGQVADALKAEHGVVHIEGHHGAVVVAVGGCQGNPGGHGAGFIDTLLENLALLVLLVIHDLVVIMGHVLLALGRVNTQLAKHPLHTKGAGLVGYYGHHPGADFLVLHQGGEDPHK